MATPGENSDCGVWGVCQIRRYQEVIAGFKRLKKGKSGGWPEIWKTGKLKDKV